MVPIPSQEQLSGMKKNIDIELPENQWHRIAGKSIPCHSMALPVRVLSVYVWVHAHISTDPCMHICIICVFGHFYAYVHPAIDRSMFTLVQYFPTKINGSINGYQWHVSPPSIRRWSFQAEEGTIADCSSSLRLNAPQTDGEATG